MSTMKSRTETVELIRSAGKYDSFVNGWGRTPEEYFEEYSYKEPQIWDRILGDLGINEDIHDRKPTPIMDEEDTLIPRLQRIKELEIENQTLREELEKYKEMVDSLLHPSENNRTMKLKIDPDEGDCEHGIMEELSGRVIFSFNGIEDYYDNKKIVCFYCGPETKEGFLLDCDDCGLYKQLEKLLTEYDVSIGEAENYHSIYVSPNQDASGVWNEVRQVLINAGAVETSF